MKVLIAGGKGQLGKTLLKTAPETVSVRSLGRPEFDITNLGVVEDVVGDEKPDVIINAAAYTAVDNAEENVDSAFLINANGPKNLSLAASKTGSRLIHISTDFVFDGLACTPYSPDSVCEPIGVYGQSKRQGEVYILDILDDPIIIRTSWLYSQFGKNFATTMLKLMNERDSIRVVADQVGGPTWATTLAKAIWSVVSNAALRGLYHWSDAGVASWYDLAVAIYEEASANGMIKKDVCIQPIRTDQFPTLAKRPAYSLFDCTLSWRNFNVAPTHWRTALRQMLATMQATTTTR